MKDERGIPRDILDKIDINKKEKNTDREVTIIVEGHQAKIPIPKIIRLKLNLKKGIKGIVTYDEKTKQIICQLK